VQTGWLRGEGDTALTIREHDWQLTLDVAEGHKTGYYLDQRDSRRRFADAVRQYGCQRAELLQLHRRLLGGGAGRRRE
jgi:23S rRNA (cytosine1962-C5)-methyltransferase